MPHELVLVHRLAEEENEDVVDVFEIRGAGGLDAGAGFDGLLLEALLVALLQEDDAALALFLRDVQEPGDELVDFDLGLRLPHDVKGLFGLVSEEQMAVFVDYLGLLLFLLHFFEVVQGGRVVFFVHVVLDYFFEVVLGVI